jgi:predicted ATPase/AraC-like DNA-binding protein
MDISGKIIHNKYQIDRQIGEDTVSYLYRARDLTPRKTPLVFRFMKHTVISKRIEDTIRFRIESNAVSELNNRNILKIVEVGEFIELMYVAMEYFPSSSLHDELNEKNIPISRSIDIIIQIGGGLECLHTNNILHRDLKPSNILIDKETVKLTGFGLSHLREFNESATSEEIIKNFKYISPEQCGVLRRTIDERSDLYSLGIIFYQLLTGRVPFEGPDICSLIHHHIAMLPDLPSRANPEIPAQLDRIVMKLLNKEPENRYQSARGLISDLERYRSGQQEFILGLNDRFTKLSYHTKLIGREREMGQLITVTDYLRGGSGAVYFITGEAGSGKTRLIEELKSAIYATGALPVEGRCSIQSTKVPNGPIKEALDAFMINYRNLSDPQKRQIADSLREEFRDLGEIIIKFNPAMKELLGECPPLVALEPERENKRFHMVISKFLLKLSDLVNGLVLVLENLQWTDEGTPNLIQEILNEITLHPLVVIGLYRNNEVPEDHVLEKLHLDIDVKEVPCVRIHLDQFDTTAMESFISGLLFAPEEDISAISDFVLIKSGGNPFFAIQILKQLIDDSVLTHKKNRWDFDNSKLDDVEIPVTIVDILLKRINKLNKNEKDILSSAAVIGDTFNMQLLFKVSSLDRTEIVRIVDKAIDLQLLIDLPTWGEIGFAHDRIKEAFYGNIKKDKRKKMHIDTANAIEETNRDNIPSVMFDLAHHFFEGGDADRAIIFAFPAGIMAMGRYANEEALNYFRLALRLLEEGGLSKTAQWIKILSNMSKVYLTIGEYDKAIDILQELPPKIKSDIEKAEIYSHICAAYLRKGDWQKCEEYAIRCGELLGEHFTDNKLMLAILLIKEIFILLVHLLVPGVFTRSRTGKTVEYNKLRAKFALPVLWSYIYSNTLKFSRIALRELNVALSKIGRSVELGTAIGGFGGILMSISLFDLAIRYHQKALAMREGLNDQWGASQSYQFLGICYLWKGNYRKSIECFEESAARFNKMGDIYETGNSYAGLVHNYLFLSEYEKLKRHLDRYYVITNETSDFYGINEAWIYSTPYFLETGDIDTAEWLGIAAYNYSIDSSNLFVQCKSHIELGKVYLEKREIQRSLKYLEHAYALYKNNNFLKHSTIHIYPALADAYLAAYTGNIEINQMDARHVLKKTGEFCKKSLGKTKRWTSYYGMALLVNAKYSAVRGRKKQAEKFFLRSIEHNKKIERRYCLARSYYEYGLFLSQTDSGSGAKKNLEIAYRIFSAIGAKRYIAELKNLLGINEDNREPTSIERRIDSERLSSIIQLANDISRISDTEQLLDRILSKAVEITGAQRGSLFIANEDNELERKASYNILGYDTIIDQYAMNIIKAVYNTQNQIIIGDAGSDQNAFDETASRFNPKSVLCVPIHDRDKTIGACYLDNSLASEAFTEKEANLLRTFLTHAATATELEVLHPRLQGKTAEKKSWQSPMISEKIQKALEYIHENYAYEISREGLASHIGLHHDNLGRYFKLYHGKKMNDYINELRIKEAARKLKETDDKIIDIAFSVGFGSLRTFNKAFREIMKISPAYYRKSRP